MKMLRGLERRLESVLDDAASRVFRGSLHPSELAGRLLRNADLSLEMGEYGPIAANTFLISARIEHPDLGSAVARELERLLDTEAFERGWRLEGPATVAFKPDSTLSDTVIKITAERRPGQRRPWAQLKGDDVFSLRVNQCVLGRSVGSDVVIDHGTVSRRHLLIWRSAGSSFASDLGSTNGSKVDGFLIGREAVELHHLSTVVLGDRTYRFELV